MYRENPNILIVSILTFVIKRISNELIEFTIDEKQTRNVIGDRGLEVVAQCFKKLKRLRVERGADEQEMEDEEGIVSQRGLTAVAEGCLDLEYIAVYISDITNAALETMGMNLKKLRDFRMVLLDREEVITDLPLDNGIQSLLSGCHELEDLHSISNQEG
ncbi:hypothetical protein L2E82_05845 [Cichorium intybus]|uniref:Uncharacterized protein n=1 Tax=Cichorium intybus TaxID=13427 RepID=A0ACB9H8D7_CICIN|nr:hypothetical protein L2E82_05845 [Cichorium intybus]